MSHWLFRIARADPHPLAGLEEADYVAVAEFDDRAVADLVEDFSSARAATLSLLQGLSTEGLGRSGILRGGRMSARAVVHILPGHVEHHFGILRDRYDLQIPPTLPGGEAG
jgi:hypothetical protein